MPLTRQERGTKAANASWTPEARITRAINNLVANWPALTEDQKQTLRTLVTPNEGR